VASHQGSVRNAQKNLRPSEGNSSIRTSSSPNSRALAAMKSAVCSEPRDGANPEYASRFRKCESARAPEVSEMMDSRAASSMRLECWAETAAATRLSAAATDAVRTRRTVSAPGLCFNRSLPPLV
jgi:hypothetical protein